MNRATAKISASKSRAKGSPKAPAKKFTGAYAAAGVDRAAADRLVGRIAGLTRKQNSLKNVRSAIGGYASLYELSPDQWLASSTDGVGTKLKLAFDWNGHRTVGIDLVAMSVNDLVCVGATPLFFLDYFATGKLKAQTAEQVIAGVVRGCEQAGCALVGGETAEMPGFYSEGEYDLAGFAVGSVRPAEVIPQAKGPKRVCPGDALIGIASSGFHSNGYSLIRRLFKTWKPGKSSPDWMRSRAGLAKELLAPTRIYVKPLLPLLRTGKVKGLAHITGSGFLNVPRISEDVSYEIALPRLNERARVYTWLKEAAFDIPFFELAQTFNMGIGMVVAVSAKDADAVLRALRKSGELAWKIGRATRKAGTTSTVTVTDAAYGREGHAVLR